MSSSETYSAGTRHQSQVNSFGLTELKYWTHCWSVVLRAAPANCSLPQVGGQSLIAMSGLPAARNSCCVHVPSVVLDTPECTRPNWSSLGRHWRLRSKKPVFSL